MSLRPVLIDGQWRPGGGDRTFRAHNPQTGEPSPEEFPVSSWNDADAALVAAQRAFAELRSIEPEGIANFLETYADRIEGRAQELSETANRETALPLSPRLADVELPRTTDQLRQAAAAARDRSWAMPTIDTKAGIRSCLIPIGPVVVMGPNNFPFAFGSASGGDFAAAVAAGNPVIAKANTSHPETTRLFAEEAHAAVSKCGLPRGSVQLLYRLDHQDGERLVADPRVGATGYTGSRQAGLKLKAAADAAGRPIYLELSSINPVVVLPGALEERGEAIAGEFADSCLMAAGQFCTNPGLVLLPAGADSERFIEQVMALFAERASGTLLSAGVAQSLGQNVERLVGAGAKLLTGGRERAGSTNQYENTLLWVSAETFLERSETFQTEAFGNASLFVVAADADELAIVIDRLEGNLTGCVYSHTAGADDALYEKLVPALRQRVGRLLNDKMPTGVAVSPAMNHGGPYPSTGHPGFTAVGIPAALRRFAMLASYDNVREHRLPRLLRDENPTDHTWRWIDGKWTQSDVAH